MELFYYLLKVSACLVLFFAFYLLVLKKLTFFKFNRFYLLASLLLSFAIPSLQFTIERVVVQAPTVVKESAEFLATETHSMETEPHFVAAESTIVEVRSVDWISLIPYAYIIVAAIILLFSLRKLALLLKHTKQKAIAVNGLKLVSKADGFTNCSFFNYVFIDEASLTKNELDILLQHESVHAKQYHSADKILVMFAKAALWFNPVVYLWDKALEQVHEYEADEATSNNFGSKEYASLLLKLAVEQNRSMLVHHFVKSPVKERIKMLFNSKSTNMKKLMYLLVAPIVLGLIWGFTVKVVEVPVSKYVIKAKDEGDPIIGKTIKGIVEDITTESKFFKTIHFKTGGEIYLINYMSFIKINKGDELTIKISSKKESVKIDENKKVVYQTPVYSMDQAFNANGDSLVVKPKIEKHAFLYEGNKARYATSKINKIDKNSLGYATKIQLNDGTFSLVFDVGSLKTKAIGFKVGDEVLVKFIGEKLTAKNIYTSSKLIAMYSQPKKFQLINPTLYSRFYSSEGFQKSDGKAFEPSIDELRSVVKIISSSSTETFPKRGITNLEDAVIMVNDVKLEAKKITLLREGGINAREATIYFPDGKVKKYGLVIYNTKQKVFGGYESAALTKENEVVNVISGPGKEGNLELSKNVSIAKMRYQASDSVRVNKIFETMLLSGKAELDIEKYKARGKVIHLDNLKKMVTVYLGSVKDENNLKIEAEVIEIDLANSSYKTKNYLK
ncbi:MAG: M56 family metallopeptidase [Pedobacter sp.]